MSTQVGQGTCPVCGQLDQPRFNDRELELLSKALAASVARISRGPGTVTELVELQTLRTKVLELAFMEVSRDACEVCGTSPTGRCDPPDTFDGDCPHGCSPER